jgi:hypothetical protein
VCSGSEEQIQAVCSQVIPMQSKKKIIKTNIERNQSTDTVGKKRRPCVAAFAYYARTNLLYGVVSEQCRGKSQVAVVT